MATRLRDVQYHAFLYAPGSGGGPGALKADLTPYLLNLIWQKGLNLAGMAAFTLVRGNPLIDSIDWMVDHVKVFREDDKGTATILAGRMVKPQYSSGDVVCLAWNYVAFLQLSRTGYNVEYPNKKLGTEVVSPEWSYAKTVADSPLEFVVTGTIENPLALDGTTEITTNEDFGVSMFNRLFAFFQIAEMAMSNTPNTVIFGISDTAPHTFSFLRNGGTARPMLLTYPGNLADHDFQPGYDLIRNDRATVVTDADGAEEEYAVTDATSIATYRRLQDALTLKTMLGLSAAAEEADQVKEGMARMLKEGIRLPKAVMLWPRQGLVSPGIDVELGDTVAVRLRDEGSGAVLDTRCRLVQMASAWTPGAGELIQMQVRGVD